MKTLIVNTFKLAIAVLAVLFILGTLAVQVQAQGYGVNGLLKGAGSGALIGQVGRDTEATLLGTVFGGMLGNMIGNEMDRKAYAMNYGLTQPVTVFHPVRQVFPHRHGKICRDFIVVERRHGYSREVVKTVCRDRHLNHFRGDYRHHFRDDYRHHFRGDHRYHFRDNHRKALSRRQPAPLERQQSAPLVG